MFSPMIQRFKNLMKEPDVKQLEAPSPSSMDDNVIDVENQRLKETIYDLIRTIRDPEKPNTLEDLNVVYEDGIVVKRNSMNNIFMVTIEFTPTIPHCSLASMIGLCIKVKLEQNLVHPVKIRVVVKPGSHNTADELSKQINDKERVAAAMENSSLREMVEKCITEEE